jgi:hypothetical protein
VFLAQGPEVEITVDEPAPTPAGAVASPTADATS